MQKIEDLEVGTRVELLRSYAHPFFVDGSTVDIVGKNGTHVTVADVMTPTITHEIPYGEYVNIA